MIHSQEDIDAAERRDGVRRKAVEVGRAMKDLFFAYFLPSAWSWRTLFFVAGHNRLKRASQIVLRDLATFCFATRTTFSSDPYIMGVREGRRQVWLRIIDGLELDEREVRKLMEIDDGVE